MQRFHTRIIRMAHRRSCGCSIHRTAPGSRSRSSPTSTPLLVPGWRVDRVPYTGRRRRRGCVCDPPRCTEMKSVSAGLPAEGRPYIMDGWYTENIIMRPALPRQQRDDLSRPCRRRIARPMFETLLTKAQFIAAPDGSLLAYDEYNSSGQKSPVKGDGAGWRECGDIG